MDARMRAMLFGAPPDDPKEGAEDPNWLFYHGDIPSQPDGDLVDNIHTQWDGDWQRLEMHHGYIQWLFPVFENAGMNFESQALSKSGAKLIRDDAVCQERVMMSYRLMLKFYGFKLVDERSGRLERDPDIPGGGSEARLRNFNRMQHNFLRVSRIITSLGELGFHRYKRPLLEALQAEVDSGALEAAGMSCARFWAPLVEQEGTPNYNHKTLEEPADREEGCLFKEGGRLA